MSQSEPHSNQPRTTASHKDKEKSVPRDPAPQVRAALPADGRIRNRLVTPPRNPTDGPRVINTPNSRGLRSVSLISPTAKDLDSWLMQDLQDTMLTADMLDMILECVRRCRKDGSTTDKGGPGNAEKNFSDPTTKEEEGEGGDGAQDAHDKHEADDEHETRDEPRAHGEQEAHGDQDALGGQEDVSMKPDLQDLIDSLPILGECLRKVSPLCNPDWEYLDGEKNHSSTAQHIRDRIHEYRIATAEKDRYKPLILLFNKILQATRDLDLPLRSAPRGIHIMFHNTSNSQQVGLSSKSRPDFGIFRSTDVNTRSSNPRPDGAEAHDMWDAHAFTTATVSPRGPRAYTYGQQLSAGEVKVFGKPLAEPPQWYTVDPDNIHLTYVPAIPPSTCKDQDHLQSEASLGTGNPDAVLTDSNALRSVASTSTRGTFIRSRSSAQQSAVSSIRITPLPSTSTSSKRKAGDALGSKAKRRRIQGDPTQSEGAMLQQITRYAYDILGSSISRTHVVNLTVNGEYSFPTHDIIRIWWFDKEKVIQSTGLNFILDLPLLVVLLATFQRFDYQDWGVGTFLTPERPKDDNSVTTDSDSRVEHAPTPTSNADSTTTADAILGSPGGPHWFSFSKTRIRIDTSNPAFEGL
ncbi:hypothetical protein PUNSTDRAFT_48132, partial [Punctularia strigosozonata HHB-11173 SS5]